MHHINIRYIIGYIFDWVAKALLGEGEIEWLSIPNSRCDPKMNNNFRSNEAIISDTKMGNVNLTATGALKL